LWDPHEGRRRRREGTTMHAVLAGGFRDFNLKVVGHADELCWRGKRRRKRRMKQEKVKRSRQKIRQKKKMKKKMEKKKMKKKKMKKGAGKMKKEEEERGSER